MSEPLARRISSNDHPDSLEGGSLERPRRFDSHQGRDSKLLPETGAQLFGDVRQFPVRPLRNDGAACDAYAPRFALDLNLEFSRQLGEPSYDILDLARVELCALEDDHVVVPAENPADRTNVGATAN